MSHGKHLVDGHWLEGDDQFAASTASGEVRQFWNGTPSVVDSAAQAADRDFPAFRSSSGFERAALLERIAERLEARSEQVVTTAMDESGLPKLRLEGELARTTGQLRLFAKLISNDEHIESRITRAQPERKPQPRPDIRLMMRPIGPVVVFGASNFPLAFSTAGGDTASALAAGCPVIVKGHPAHPATSELVAETILEAINESGVPAGVFALIQDSGVTTAQQLVQHDLVEAVGFTGSLAAGRALHDLCAARSRPIPFFGELGSVNPSFVLPGALADRGEEIASGWAASLCMGAGQFCTNPGVLFVAEGEDGDKFSDAVVNVLSGISEQTMLTDGIAAACDAGVRQLASLDGVEQLVSGLVSGREVAPSLFEVSSNTWRKNPELAHEVFGPVAIIVRTQSVDEFGELAASLEGQLTASLHLDPSDEASAAKLLSILERKAGRLLVNGFPTGVEVDSAMMHGGPYPASTNASHTSVGTLAIRRFLRPVCFQNVPESLLPVELRD